MPIEIKELHIRAVVVPGEKEARHDGRLPADELNRLKKEITKDVTEMVLNMLRKKTER